jgi:hypothetical protein
MIGTGTGWYGGFREEDVAGSYLLSVSLTELDEVDRELRS